MVANFAKIAVYDFLDAANVSDGGESGDVMKWVSRLRDSLDIERRWAKDIEDTCREAGKTEFGTCRFIGELADRVRQQNTTLEAIADACILLGMPIDGDPVEFLAGIGGTESGLTIRDCVINILNAAA